VSETLAFALMVGTAYPALLHVAAYSIEDRHERIAGWGCCVVFVFSLFYCIA
jgi:hypothetical protein